MCHRLIGLFLLSGLSLLMAFPVQSGPSEDVHQGETLKPPRTDGPLTDDR